MPDDAEKNLVLPALLPIVTSIDNSTPGIYRTLV